MNPLCRHSWFKMMKKHQLRWNADAGKEKKEERRKNEKGPDTGTDFVEKILLFKK